MSSVSRRIATAVMIAGASSILLAAGGRPLPAASGAASGSCARPSVQRALRHALVYARDRYRIEQHGLAAHIALDRAARDRRLLHDLSTHDRAAARAEANRLLVGHLVRLRIAQGPRLLLDANPSSFAVAGPSKTLVATNRRTLGRLTVSIQDVIGFVKLVYRHAPAYAVVRGARGQVRSSLPRPPPSLPASGCPAIAGRRYAVSSFPEVSFSGEPLTVWILVPGS